MSTGTSTGTPPGTTPGGAPPVTSNEVATPPGPLQHGRGYASAEVAVRAFVQRFVNWDAADVKARLEGLARASVGQARTAMALEAAQTGADPELAQTGVANHGTVEAVAPVPGRGRYVAVTLESTSAADSSAYEGLAPAWHLALVRVSRRGNAWVVSGFQPED
jgi:hypothetical protein